MPRPRLRFRTKIFLALGALVWAALAIALLVVRDAATRRAWADADERFARAQNAFERLQWLRTRFVSDAVEALAATNPQFRTVLSTVSVGEQDLGFADAGDPAEGPDLHDANLRLRSLLPSLALAQRGEIFVVTSASGELLYASADPERVGDDLGGLAVLQEASSSGLGVGFWSRAEDLPSGVRLAPNPPPAVMYEVVARPVVFGEEVHGFVLVGNRIDAGALQEVRAISGLDVALVSAGGSLVSTFERGPGDALAARLGRDRAAATGIRGPLANGGVEEWELAGRRFLVGRAELAGTGTSERPRFLVFASLDETLGLLRAVERALVAAGGVALLLALLVAFALARGITRPLSALAHAALRIGRGDLASEISIRTGDELEELGETFNLMVQGLRERDRIRHTFERHVSKPVAEEILRNPGSVRRAGERREVTVLFADLGGFAGFAETRSPEAVVARLNSYFEAVCDVVLSLDGTVNELLGDGVLAFFGAPIAQADHAERASLAALRCAERLASLTADWRQQGVADLRYRLGVHTGPVVVGEMGTSERSKYGAIGDAVNLASRIEGACRYYEARVLASGATREAAGPGIEWREVDRVRVAGRETPVVLHEPLGRKGEVPAALLKLRDRYQAALDCYRAGDWKGAERAFAKLAAAHPQDGATRAMLERVRFLRAAGPHAAWDGIFDLPK